MYSIASYGVMLFTGSVTLYGLEELSSNTESHSC